jgi:hypothetical protein
MPVITVNDGTELYYKDLGSGQPHRVQPWMAAI